MKGNVSPAVAAVIVIVVLVIVGFIGMKVLGGSKSSDNVDPAQIEAYKKGMDPEAQKKAAMEHMKGPGAGAPR